MDRVSLNRKNKTELHTPPLHGAIHAKNSKKRAIICLFWYVMFPFETRVAFVKLPSQNGAPNTDLPLPLHNVSALQMLASQSYLFQNFLKGIRHSPIISCILTFFFNYKLWQWLPVGVHTCGACAAEGFQPLSGGLSLMISPATKSPLSSLGPLWSH